MSESRKAAIHDLGYQRYVGTRRPQSTRYQVIVRNLCAMSWKGYWRYKLPLAITAMTTVGIGVGIYFSRHKIFAGSPAESQIHSIADGLIPQSFGYFGYAALLVSLTVLAGAISRDLRGGAFEFYFSRPVRPVDYVLGKLGGAVVLLAPMLLIAPFLLTVYRLALTGDVDQTVDTLPWLPKALLVGSASTLAYASVALAFGAISKSPRYAIAGFGAFVFIFGSVVTGISLATKTPALAALDFREAINGFAAGVFEVESLFGLPPPSLLASTISLASYTTISILFITYRVRQAQRAGMGGG